MKSPFDPIAMESPQELSLRSWMIKIYPHSLPDGHFTMSLIIPFASNAKNQSLSLLL